MNPIDAYAYRIRDKQLPAGRYHRMDVCEAVEGEEPQPLTLDERVTLLEDRVGRLEAL